MKTLKQMAEKWAIKNWKGAFEMQDGPDEQTRKDWQKAYLGGAKEGARSAWKHFAGSNFDKDNDFEEWWKEKASNEREH